MRKIIYFIPISDYFLSRKGLFVKFLLPLMIACISLILSIRFNIIGDSEKVLYVFSEFINTQTNIIAILISFSVAIITILVSSDSKNIEKLKETQSSTVNYKPVNKERLSLFQVLLSGIAYNIVIEIFYLLCLIALSLMKFVFPVSSVKYIVSICIFFVLHIFLVLLESVVQMYFTFWTKKE